MPLTDHDFLSETAHQLWAEVERLQERQQSLADEKTRVLAKLVAGRETYDQRLAAELDATPDTRRRLRKELELDALEEQLHDLTIILDRLPDGIERARRAYHAQVRREAAAALAKLGAQVDARCAEILKAVAPLLKRHTVEVRDLWAQATRWGNAAGHAHPFDYPPTRLPAWRRREEINPAALLHWIATNPRYVTRLDGGDAR